MLHSRTLLTSYRGIAGRPKPGVQVPGKMVGPWIDAVHRRARELRTLSAAAFTTAAADCRRRIKTPAEARRVENVIESFALTGQALCRATGLSYYDVQWMGGFALSAGTIAEIQTGEGKTITTALPAVLHGWSGRGVHVATTNDYLSRRDHDQLKPVFEMLGLTVGHLEPQSPLAQKVNAYRCDITYGPGYEFGFDFLKDQLALRERYREQLGERFLRRLAGEDSNGIELAQRGQAFAIIDEADSVLIDEATTPLILSGGQSASATSPALYHYAHDLALELTDGLDYHIDRLERTIVLSDAGWQRIRDAFDSRPTGQLARPWNQLVEHALRANFLLHRDVDYVVLRGAVLIVDNQTGRIHEERKWSSGLHQAVEVKERVEVTPENETHARITRQRCLGFYDGVAGLTGTAADSEAELREFYQLPVVQIPTHKPCLRKQLPLRSFASRESKYNAIADDAATRSGHGQPVLIGTRSIDESKQLSKRLGTRGIRHVVLNGLQDESEAAIVARAGVAGAVTVATNMAGRGTDIRLESLSLAAGGLHVTASEVHLCRRVDRQLAGRAARQGDPGSCQFYTSAEDELIETRAPALAAQMSATSGENGESRRDFSAAVRRVQQQAEAAALRQRQQMVAHDDWVESVQAALAQRA